jgi:hypothetical protein
VAGRAVVKIGDSVLYWSPVNQNYHEAEVVDLWDDHHADVKIQETYKIRIPIHMKELPFPFQNVRGQRIPLAFIAYEADS